jgi:drug/metabolite transporter (DMT)-like permease
VKPLGALSGFAAAGCWGVGVFAGGLASRRASVLATLIVADTTGALLALAVAVASAEDVPDIAGWAWAAAAGLCGLIGALAFLRAILVNPIGLITSTATMVSAGVPILFGIVTDDRPSALQWIGMLAVLAAAVLVALPAGSRTLDRGALVLALTAGLWWGVFYICMSQAAASGAYTWWPIAASRAAAGAAAIAVALVGSRLTQVRRQASPLMVGAGAIDVAGTSLFLLSSSQSSLSIAAVTSSMYPAVTVLLSRAVLREHLAGIQIVGIVLALAGITLMALP